MKNAFFMVRMGLGFVVGVFAIVVAVAAFQSSRLMHRSFEVQADEDPGAPVGGVEASIERGRHLITARYGCLDCHGEDLGGGTMVDAAPIGRILGPNLTSGEGGVVSEYTFADWDRIVRHGVRPDGRPAVMPSVDFREMSDQELDDLIAYIEAQPPVDAEVPEPRFGPVGMILVATGQFRFSADRLADRTEHRAFPPDTEVSIEFGAHLGAVCSGCHGINFSGGPIPGGDPSWAAASNLTPHGEGLSSWSLDDFRSMISEGVGPDGEPVLVPMTLALPILSEMTDIEVEALWMYLQSLEPMATGA